MEPYDRFCVAHNYDPDLVLFGFILLVGVYVAYRLIKGLLP
jgi:hypothetical protein